MYIATRSTGKEYQGQNITTLANGAVIVESWMGLDEQIVFAWPGGNINVTNYSANSEIRDGMRVPDSAVVYPPNLRGNAPLKLEGVGGTTMTFV